MRVHAILGDLAAVTADAVVRPAPPGRLRRARVDDLGLLAAAGPRAQAAFAELFGLLYPAGWQPGQACSTTAGDLPARWLIHVAVPLCSQARPEYLLARAYRSVLEVADELGATSLAMPPLGMVSPYWPLSVATRILQSTLPHTVTAVRQATLVARTAAAHDVLTAALARPC
jgi:O-acetyl-ADP-ribose deacetylase